MQLTGNVENVSWYLLHNRS